MKKSDITIFFLTLFCSVALNAQVNRADTKKSIPYKANYKRMTAGYNHTLEIRDGTLWVWGSNTSGQLGDGSTVNKSSPVKIGTDNKWVNIAAGMDYSVGLKSDGTLWAWGYNLNGQLGDGSTVSKSSPVQIGADTKWVCITAGGSHTLGLKSDGTLWAWGNNQYGRLGDGTTVNKSSPVQIGVDNKWVSVSAGYFHTIGMKSDGTLWAWGYNLNGQLGDGTTVDKSSPVQIGVDNKWICIKAGGNHSVGLKSDGTFWNWGNNAYGQLGDGTTVNKSSPIQVGVDNKWSYIAGGVYHTLGIKTDGTLWAWGYNSAGQLGEGSTVNKSSPVQIGIDIKWVSITAGFYHTLGLKSDGIIWAWGRNSEGQLGDGTIVDKINPVQTSSVLIDWLCITAGQNHSLGIKSGGTLWAWGYNLNGQLGDGTTVSKSYPVQIGTDNKWVSITTGYSHTLGIKSDGTLWAWGKNFSGQLGDGTTADKNSPVQVGVDNKWVSVTAGGNHSLGLKSDGTLWAWGYNGYGQLGDGTIVGKNNPVQIGVDNKWVSITAGENHSLGIKSDGTLWAWGWNTKGQLGDGTIVNKSSPLQIGVDIKWVNISAGGFHTLGTKSDGTLWAWGFNGLGELGDGTIVDKTSPLQIGADNKWICITTGVKHSFGIKSDGTLWAWGYNFFGELGDGTTADKNSPLQIGAENKWINITAGYDFTLGLKSDRRKFCGTGQNTFGQLGDGSTINSSVFLCNTNCNVSLSISSSINISCNGGNNGSATASVTGGNSPFTYLWNPSAQTTSVAVALSADNYTVAVTDLDDCISTATVTITEPAVLTSTTTVTDVSCFGTNSGNAIVIVNGGTVPYTYNWSAGGTTSAVNNLFAGSYSVVITDANGCSDTAYAAVNEPTLLSVADVITNVTCNAGNDGAIDITTSGGTTPYTFNWSPGGFTTEDVSGLTAGTYSLLVTDANNCTSANTYTVSQPPAIAANLTVTNVSCNGGNNGSATINVTTGVSPFTYQWDSNAGSQTTQTALGLSVGTYSVTVTDADGCTGTFSDLVKQPPVLTSTITPTNVNCNGGSNGSVNLSVGGGTSPYTFLWSTNATTQNISNLPAGNYSVIITDANGCTATNSVVVNQPTLLTSTINKTDVTCNGLCNGTATANPSGGTPPYFYSWQTGPVQTTQTATGLCPATYNVNISDNNNCQITPNVTISQPNVLVVSVSSSDATCNNSDGSITANPSGGTTPYTYNWSNGNSNQTAYNLTAGNYSVSITDANGCTASASVTVSVISTPQPICIVTVDSFSMHNQIIWEKSASAPIDSFRIYREVASVFTPFVTLPYSTVSFYTDTTTGINPNITAYKYKISAIDSCGNESAQSAFHRTIHLAVVPASPCGYYLTWNDYIGITVTQYKILRDTSNNGNFQLIDSVSFGNTAWTDTTCYTSADTVTYVLEIDHPIGCTATLKNPLPMATNLNTSRSNNYRISDTTLTSVYEVKDDFVLTYPNPNSGLFNVQMSKFENSKMKSIEIYNMYGAKVYSNEAFDFQNISSTPQGVLRTNFQIDLRKHSKGVYFLQISTDEKVIAKKIIIE